MRFENLPVAAEPFPENGARLQPPQPPAGQRRTMAELLPALMALSHSHSALCAAASQRPCHVFRWIPGCLCRGRGGAGRGGFCYRRSPDRAL